MAGSAKAAAEEAAATTAETREAAAPAAGIGAGGTTAVTQEAATTTATGNDESFIRRLVEDEATAAAIATRCPERIQVKGSAERDDVSLDRPGVAPYCRDRSRRGYATRERHQRYTNQRNFFTSVVLGDEYFVYAITVPPE